LRITSKEKRLIQGIVAKKIRSIVCHILRNLHLISIREILAFLYVLNWEVKLIILHLKKCKKHKNFEFFEINEMENKFLFDFFVSD